MNTIKNAPARLTLSLLTTAAIAAGATAALQASAQNAQAASPAVVGAWNATFNHDGQLNPVLVTFHGDGTLLMSGVGGEGSSSTIGSWRAAQNGEVAFEARVLGAQEGKYMGQIHMNGTVNVQSGQLTGTIGGRAVAPNGQVMFGWEGETFRAFRITPAVR